jgi:hypothetical protein
MKIAVAQLTGVISFSKKEKIFQKIKNSKS